MLRCCEVEIRYVCLWGRGLWVWSTFVCEGVHEGRRNSQTQPFGNPMRSGDDGLSLIFL